MWHAILEEDGEILVTPTTDPRMRELLGDEDAEAKAVELTTEMSRSGEVVHRLGGQI